ncbi:FecR domain-containing protein [Brevundimonas sp.]|uniref:FecR family protein n=1 Tax=Brevundimonas sp. TaxID=1871086 RepID=UPI001ACA6472|nr:FecR domain-containing protein [Brevundimonas sp.]MBN9466266.1 FecR domain-containing protein [Brevundimonas sp.]
MSAQQRKRSAADDEATAWIARLGTRTISLDTVQEFADWRRDPVNAEAYRRAEEVWSKSGALADDPDIKSALGQALQRKPSAKFGVPKQAMTFAALAGVAATIAISVFLWQGRDVYQTGVGELRVVELDDGSRVQLDTASRLKVRFTDGERRIELTQGQAYFEVAHDTARPFIVSTSDASVTAIGTVFEVRRVGPETRVVLVSGAVDIRQAGAATSPQRLAPNQESAIRDGRTQVRPVDAQASTSWTSGELTFVDTPLAEAVAEVNRYLLDPIVLDAPNASSTSINGVFRSGDRTAFVSAAAHLLDLRVVNEPGGKVRLVSPRINAGA